MNKLVSSSESLNNVLEGKALSREDLLELYHASKDRPAELFAASQALRKKFKGNRVTFSKKAFLNIVNLCRDTCSYCTYKAEPSDAKLSLMSRQQIRDMLALAKRYRCVEALLVTGEAPEQRYSEARAWLRSNGFASTAEYLVHASELALELGLFPHTNAGNLQSTDMAELQKTNVSMGLMLESASDRLCGEAMPHHLAPSKRPGARLAVLENAGRLGIPMTTGLLVGIGETASEMVDSVLAIRDVHQRFGHIQEVILQNFRPKPGTLMASSSPARENYFKVIVALTRLAMPKMNIQVPPNLSPESYQSFLPVGINDWGGISPLTPDYVNPEFPWPSMAKIRQNSRLEGFELRCRFPVYPEFIPSVGRHLRDRMAVIGDDGLVREDYWS